MTVLILIGETLLAPLVAMGVVLYFLLSRRRALLAAIAQELPERFGFVSEEARLKLLGRQVWWFHAASAGEVDGLAPVFDAFWNSSEPPAVLVTTMTAAGRAAARRNPRITWAQLVPLDCWPALSFFLAAANPHRLVLTETEIWPSMIVLAKRAGLDPILVNARLSARSFPRYAAASLFLRPALARLGFVLAQTEIDAERFRQLGMPAERVRVCGNTKFDRRTPRGDDEAARQAISRLRWEASPLFVAGSTHPLEEETVIDAFVTARQHFPDLRLVIAPRHVERAHETLAAIRQRNLTLAQWTRREDAPPSASVLLIDAMGVLGSFWNLARVSFVGGTLVPVGGHNLLEPAAAGVPVLFGPDTRHIEEPASQLEACAGGLRIADSASLSRALCELLGNPARAQVMGSKAREVSALMAGATGRVLAFLSK